VAHFSLPDTGAVLDAARQRQRFAANTRYFGALWASSGDRAGETYRQLARWSLIAAAVMAIVFVALGVAAVS
jgi:hypothetical protein